MGGSGKSTLLLLLRGCLSSYGSSGELPGLPKLLGRVDGAEGEQRVISARARAASLLTECEAKGRKS